MRTLKKLAVAAAAIATPTALFAGTLSGVTDITKRPAHSQALAHQAAIFATPGEAAGAARYRDVYRVSQLAAATTNPTRQAAPNPSSEPQHALLSDLADSINVRFQGFKEINGTYRLNEDETISIPGVGRISIAGMTAKDFEDALVKHILISTGREAPVSVEVSTYRHVFVDGIVDKPGSFQWQRGLTVIKAVSMTGGVYRPNSNRLSAESPIAQRGRLDIARLMLAQALVRHARLTAELEDQPLLPLPERLIGIYGANRANELITGEQTILDNRRALVKARLQTFDSQQQSIQAEVERLEELANGMRDRTKNYAGLLAKLRQTHRQGGISNQRLFEVENRLGDLEEKLASTNVQLVRARSALQQVASKRSELTESRREKMIEEETKTKTDIGTLQIQYDVALDSISSQAGGATVSIDDTDASPEFSYEIIRRSRGREQRIAAAPLDLLMPGDTLIVARTTAPAVSTVLSGEQATDTTKPTLEDAPSANPVPDRRSKNHVSKHTQYTTLPAASEQQRMR